MVASEQHLYQTIVLPRKLATGSLHDYLFFYCPLVGILFEVLRMCGPSPQEPTQHHRHALRAGKEDALTKLPQGKSYSPIRSQTVQLTLHGDPGISRTTP